MLQERPRHPSTSVRLRVLRQSRETCTEPWLASAALTSTLHWFGTELLPHEDNLVELMTVDRGLIGQAETFDRADRIVLDMDSSESPVHGQQEGSAYNGHFESVCYHPLFLFNDHGDCVAAKLRSGNVHSADDWGELLVPEIERQHANGRRARCWDTGGAR